METATMTHSAEIGEIAKSLCAVQADCPTIPKNRQGYGYKYCDINDMLVAILPLLKKNDLAIFQSVERLAGQSWMATLLMHKSGQWMKGLVPYILAKQDMQGVGTAATYSRRYGLAAALGLASDEDTDGVHPMDKSKQPPTPAQAKPVYKQETPYVHKPSAPVSNDTDEVPF